MQSEEGQSMNASKKEYGTRRHRHHRPTDIAFAMARQPLCLAVAMARTFCDRRRPTSEANYAAAAGCHQRRWRQKPSPKPMLASIHIPMGVLDLGG